MLRSFAFAVAYWVMSVFYALACAFAALVPGRGPVAWTLRLYTRRMLWAMHWIAGIKVDVKGKERLPKGAFIIAAKHHSWGDGFVMFSHIDNLAFVTGDHLERIPLLRGILHKFGAIVVDNCGGPEARQALAEKAAAANADGRRILIFPEGNLAKAGERYRYRTGVFHMYRDFDLPVVPVATNLGLFWPQADFQKHRGRATRSNSSTPHPTAASNAPSSWRASKPPSKPAPRSSSPKPPANRSAPRCSSPLRTRWRGRRRSSPKVRASAMTGHPPPRYTLRSATVLSLGCFAAAVAGVELGGAALQVAGLSFSGRPIIDRGEYPGGAPDFLYALAFWDLFLLPGPLVGLLLIGWPALLVIRSSQPDRLGPRLAYAVGLLATVLGQCLVTAPTLAIFGGVPPLKALVGLLSGSGELGTAFGLPAAVVFRLTALRRIVNDHR